MKLIPHSLVDNAGRPIKRLGQVTNPLAIPAHMRVKWARAVEDEPNARKRDAAKAKQAINWRSAACGRCTPYK
jgi:hypothetical protein